MILPPYLKPGDLIGITCPASKMEREAAEYAAAVLESWNFKTLIGATVGTHYHNFSATDTERLTELQNMLDNDNVKAILFGRGGYGVIRILDQIDFSYFIKNPKWICGYSDITALHVHLLTCFGIASIHSVMCSGITPETSHDMYVNSLRQALSGKRMNLEFDPHPFNCKGSVSGQLIGGNLSLLVNLSGTISQPDMKEKILFIEDVGEYRYSIDRMMYNLERAGWLKDLSGLIVGSFNDGKETQTHFGQTEFEIIKERVSSYHYPVCYNFPTGHQKENYALKEGGKYKLIIEDTCFLKEE